MGDLRVERPFAVCTRTDAREAWLGRTDRALRRALPRRARRLDDRRSAAVDPQRPAPVDELAPVGGERVRARLRRLPPAGRPRGRPARETADVPDLARRLPGRLWA